MNARFIDNAYATITLSPPIGAFSILLVLRLAQNKRASLTLFFRLHLDVAATERSSILRVLLQNNSCLVAIRVWRPSWGTFQFVSIWISTPHE